MDFEKFMKKVLYKASFILGFALLFVGTTRADSPSSWITSSGAKSIAKRFFQAHKGKFQQMLDVFPDNSKDKSYFDDNVWTEKNAKTIA